MEAHSLRNNLVNCLIFSMISLHVGARWTDGPMEVSPFDLPNLCPVKQTCEQCIQTLLCAWCYDPINNSETPRCFRPQPNETCPEEFTVNPDTVMNIHQGNNRQLSPQKIDLKLRKGESQRFTLNYHQLEGYPLDVYYLMDATISTHYDKENISNLANELVHILKNLTSKYRIGFGSFVDKGANAEKNHNNCKDCPSPYGFKHHMNLGTDTDMFLDMVNKTQLFDTLKNSEGGLNAIMQAAVCHEQIGWRKEARKVIVYSTDAGLRQAGVQKWDGIVTPNDGKCHMSSDGLYVESSIQDYPSVEQIHTTLKKNAINVIFAASENIFNVYERLAVDITDDFDSFVHIEENPYFTIETGLKKQYEKIEHTIEIKHNASEDVSIQFSSSCSYSCGTIEPVNTCYYVGVGHYLEFFVDIEVTKCNKNSADNLQIIEFYPVGVDESLIIDLEMICQCDCEKPGDKYHLKNSTFCSSQGTFKCGICECNPGIVGDTCGCSPQHVDENTTQTSCLHPNSTSGVECSGKGKCACGHCECETRSNVDERIYGEYCECDNFSCQRHNGQICGGPEHGTCDCGVCQCTDGWTGSDCSCKRSNHTCVSPVDGKLCSGHGECECNKCKCEVTPDGRYSGKFCERCPTCLDRFDDFKNYVKCSLYRDYSGGCSVNTNETVRIGVYSEIIANEENGEVKCTYYNADGCRFSFAYGYDDYYGNYDIWIRGQYELDCPKKLTVATDRALIRML